MIQDKDMYIYTYGGCPKFFLLETAILSQKKFTLAKLSPYSQKTFADPMLDCIWEFLLGNRSLTRDICVSERPSKLILWRLRIHVSRFAFNGGPCSPSPASSDTPTPKLRAHLLPASLQTRHNKRITSQQFRPPSFQEKAVFRQALSKLSPNFREKSPYINFIFKNPCMFQSYLTTFAKLSPKNNLL